MLRFKLLRYIFAFLIAVIISVIVFYFFNEEETDLPKTATNELKKPGRSLIMKNPSMEWGEHHLSADEMEVLKNENMPQKETQVFRNFVFRKKGDRSGVSISGDKAILETYSDIEAFTEIRMSGKVKCELASGWYISSGSLVYHQGGTLDSKTPVTFGGKNATGSAETFLYNSLLGKVLISGNINMTIEPPPSMNGEPTPEPTHVAFDSLEYDTNTGEFVISGLFYALRGDEFLTGKSVQGQINPSSQKIISFDVLENARMCFKETTVPTEERQPKKDERSPFNFDGLKVISSPSIKYRFWEDEKNSIKSINTVRPSSLFIHTNNLDEKEKLRIYANEFSISSSQENSGLDKMTADGKVEITQILTGKQGITRRVISCETFNGWFNEQGASDKIIFLGGLTITEPSYSINSGSGTYTAEDSQLKFDGSPMLVHEEGISAAESIKFDAAKNLLILTNNVVTKIKNKNSAEKVFNKKEDIYINSVSMTYDADKNTSLYKTNVKIYQGKSQIFADSIEMNNDSKIMIAKGKTNGRIYDVENAPASAADSKTGKNPGKDESKIQTAGEQKYLDFSCDKMTIDENNNRVRLEKKGRVFQSTGEEIKGDKIEYRFRDKIMAPVTIEANGNTTFKKLPYESSSEYLNYDYEKDLINLKGQKVVLLSGGKPFITARELTFKSSGDIINIKSLPGERIEAVWKTETKAKGDREDKKKK